MAPISNEELRDLERINEEITALVAAVAGIVLSLPNVQDVDRDQARKIASQVGGFDAGWKAARLVSELLGDESDLQGGEAPQSPDAAPDQG